MENKKKVLVVDDDDNLRMVLMDKLGASGFEVADAPNGEEGLKKALEWHPEVILLDVMMPKMNGWQMLNKVRTDAWGKTARVIMLTGLDDVTNVAHAVGKGVREYILKTNINLDELVKTVSAS
ncbi:MAG TPA: response regulator [Candidatus Paceibacterota bacterium]